MQSRYASEPRAGAPPATAIGVLSDGPVRREVQADAPKFVIRDQDAKFAGFDAVFTAIGARIIKATVLAPPPGRKAARRTQAARPVPFSKCAFEVRFVRSGNRQAG